MRDPERLVENPSSEVEGRLLEVGRSYRASARTRARVLVAVGVAGASSSLAGAATAKLIGSKLGLFAAAGVAVSVAAGGLVLTRSSEPAAKPQTVQAQVQPARTATPVRTPAEDPPAAVEAPPTEEAPAAPVRPAKPGKSAKTPSVLQEELARLDSASTLLRSGAAAEALAALDRYERDFPSGKLRMESAVLRIEALARAGQAQRARTLADAFLKRHSASVLATRVRRYATPP